MVNDPPSDQRRTFLPHVEGLRGLTALYVFVFHFRAALGVDNPKLDYLKDYTSFFNYGHYAVVIFIVISGYCLALPVVRRGPKNFDARAFAKRRIYRIYPAYVAALVFSTAVFRFWAPAHFRHVASVSSIAVGFALHALLIHNLFERTSQYMNGPMWSVGLESQIYVLFALLLVPVWERFGVFAQVGAAYIVGLAPHFLFQGALDWTCPWFVGLFATGVAAAYCANCERNLMEWRIAAAALIVLSVIVVVVSNVSSADETQYGQFILTDVMVGTAVAALFVASLDGAGELWGPARILALGPFVRAGTFSYSIYLLHQPMIFVVREILRRTHAGTTEKYFVYGFLFVVVLAIAYGFYCLFERPFMSRFLQRAVERPKEAFV